MLHMIRVRYRCTSVFLPIYMGMLIADSTSLFVLKFFIFYFSYRLLLHVLLYVVSF